MKRLPLVFLGAIAAVAIALRAHGLGWGLPEVYEEAYPFKQAWGMWGFGGGGFDPHPHFFKYPSLTIYLQLLGQAVTIVGLKLAGVARSGMDLRVLHATDPSAFYLVGRAITALFGAATVFPAYALARRAGEGAGLVAALLVAISVPLIEKSQVIEVDVPLTFFVALGLVAAVRLAERPTARRVLEAGVVAGLAASAKYPGLLLLVPLTMAWIVADRVPAGGSVGSTRAAAPRGRTGARKRPHGREAPPRPRARASTLGWLTPALLLAGAAAAFFVTSPYVLLDRTAFWADLAAEREHMRLGHFGATAGHAWATYARLWFTGLLGWPLGIASLVGLVLSAIRRERWAWIAASFALAYFAIVGSWTMKVERYLLPLVPVAAAGGAALIGRLLRTATPRAGADPTGGGAAARPAFRRLLTVGAFALGVLVLALPSVLAYPRHARTLGPDTRTEAKAFVLAHYPPGSWIASEFYGPELLNVFYLATLERDLAEAIVDHGAAVYAAQTVPLFQVAPERASGFYDLAHYWMADAIILTSSVHDRYAAEPVRFGAQLAFYDSVRSRFVKRATFVPRSGSGPGIEIYDNPARRPPFAAATDPPGPAPYLGPTADGAAYFFLNQGVNYEAFGFRAQAVAAYREGLGYIGDDRGQAISLALRLGHCLLEDGVPTAEARLDSAIAGARNMIEASALRSIRRRIASDRERFERSTLPALEERRRGGG